MRSFPLAVEYRTDERNSYGTCFLSALAASHGTLSPDLKPLPKATTVRSLVSLGKDAGGAPVRSLRRFTMKDELMTAGVPPRGRAGDPGGPVEGRGIGRGWDEEVGYGRARVVPVFEGDQGECGESLRWSQRGNGS